MDNATKAMNKLYEMANNSKKVISLGTGTSFDVKNYYSNYQSLTINDFYIKPSATINTKNWYANAALGNTVGSYGVDSLTAQINFSYNASTGILTANLSASAEGGAYIIAN